MNGVRLDCATMGFSMTDRINLIRLSESKEEALENTRINEWFTPDFFHTNFWYMWMTTFAFTPFHSALELKRYMHRFMHEFPRMDTLVGVTRTPYNQYDSLILPLQKWLQEKGVKIDFGCTVTDV
jgi:oleate hydratase